MLKTRWKPYMTIHYCEPHDKNKITYEMMLIGIEFDDECVHCVPLHDGFESDEFYINIRYISIPTKRDFELKLISNSKPKVNTMRKF